MNTTLHRTTHHHRLNFCYYVIQLVFIK